MFWATLECGIYVVPLQYLCICAIVYQTDVFAQQTAIPLLAVIHSALK